MTPDEKINARARRAERIDRGTGRPDSVYPKTTSESIDYVRAFSFELGLRPTPTQFGDRVVRV